MPAASATQAESHESQEVLRAIIRERVDSKRSSGVVVGVVDKAGIQIAAYGDPGPRQPGLDSLTVFEIGSLTKVFTATLLMKMALRGEVSLTDPVSAYLPRSARLPKRGGREIRLLDLATHRSGLPRLPTNLRSGDPRYPLVGYTAADLYQYLAQVQLAGDIGVDYEYSDIGFGLLGHALSLKAGLDYGELLRAHILEPLGMAMTSTRLSPSLRRRFALPHDDKGQVIASMDVGILAGSGAILSNASDMLTFGSANLFSTGDLLHRAMQEAHPSRHSATNGQRLGLGWQTAQPLDREFIWQSGETAGSRSFLGLDRAAARAVVVLSNSASTIEDIGFNVLDERNRLADQ